MSRIETISGIPVKDADQELTIHITGRDVRFGNTKDPGACAAARCLMRQPHVEAARVHLSKTYVKINGKWMRYNTPPNLRTEIVAFDRGGTFQPGMYTLKVIHPSEIKRRGKAHGKSTPNDERGGGSKRKRHYMVSGVRPHGANR